MCADYNDTWNWDGYGGSSDWGNNESNSYEGYSEGAYYSGNPNAKPHYCNLIIQFCIKNRSLEILVTIKISQERVLRTFNFV